VSGEAAATSIFPGVPPESIVGSHLFPVTNARSLPRPAPLAPRTRHLLFLVPALTFAGCGAQEAVPLSAEALVGDAVCLQCHEAMATYTTTAHSRTSALATATSVHGSFAEGENVLRTGNPYLHYRMVAAGGELRQQALQTSGPDSVAADERLDLVIGSGRKGQSYLYWRDDRLFQLPVSYWRGIGWANSPGYPDGMAIFSRAVNPRCLECHATYAEAQPGLSVANRYDTTSLVLGISCESCHGAGRAHVEAESSGNAWMRASAIVNPAELPREREIEVCAICHGGIGESVQPPFSFRPGEPLSAYLDQPEPRPGEAPDVHGNQVALLARSPCFQGSKMTCSTCHHVHRPQREAADFSSVCTSCHEPGDAIPQEHGAAMPGNCVDCHMPEQQTDVIVGNDVTGVLRPRVRTHWIRVYEEARGTGGA
jgi:hypothetical protein